MPRFAFPSRPERPFASEAPEAFTASPDSVAEPMSPRSLTTLPSAVAVPANTAVSVSEPRMATYTPGSSRTLPAPLTVASAVAFASSSSLA